MAKEYNWVKDHKEKNIDPVDCPNRIRLLRFEKDWSSGELGKRIGSARSTILDYERGRLWPGSNVIGRLCDVFNVKSGDLFWRKGEKEAILKERKSDKDG